MYCCRYTCLTKLMKMSSSSMLQLVKVKPSIIINDRVSNFCYDVLKHTSARLAVLSGSPM